MNDAGIPKKETPASEESLSARSGGITKKWRARRLVSFFLGIIVTVNLTYALILLLIRFSVNMAIVAVFSFIPSSQEFDWGSVHESVYHLPSTLAIIALICSIGIFIVLSLTQYRDRLVRYLLDSEGTKRLSFEEIFANDHRRLLIETILSLPGVHFSELQRISGLQTGNLQYHLQKLEDYKIISSKKIGQFKCYFPVIGQNPLTGMDLAIMKSETTFLVYRYIQEHPGKFCSTIAKHLGKNKNTVSYHIKKLLKNSLIYEEKDGAGKRIYITQQNKLAVPKIEDYLSELEQSK